MTRSPGENVLRTVLHINAGWLIWAGCVASARLLPPGSVLVLAVGAAASAGMIALLYRFLSSARAHRTALAPRGDLAVDYLSSTVAALSLVGMLWMTITSMA